MSVTVEEFELMVKRLVILEDQILMLSHNARCLEIRQGSQPIELPNVVTEGPYVYKMGNEHPELKLPDLDFIQPEVRNMLGLNFVEQPFGEDEVAWAK